MKTETIAGCLCACLTLSFATPTMAQETDQTENQETVIVDEVSVTATREERPTKDVPAAIDVIGAETIESRKMFNIKEALEGTPGVLVDSKNGGFDVRLIVRGAGLKANYGVREIMVLRDGVPMTDPDSFTRFDFIDTQDIERIEVTKGPGNIYGAGSAGGTIQILSKSVFDNQANRIRLGIGSYGALNDHIRLSTDFDDGGQALALTATRRSLDNGWRRWNEFESQQAGIKYGYLMDNGGTIESELSYTEADIQLPGSMDETQFQAYLQTGKQTDNDSAFDHSGRYSQSWFFNTKYEQEIGNLVLRPRIYANHWGHYHPVTGAINDADNNLIAGADLEGSYAHNLWGESSLVTGVSLRTDRSMDRKKYEYADVVVDGGTGEILATLSDRSGDLMETQDSVNSLFGVFLQESVQPAEGLLVDIGLRYDRSYWDMETDEITRYDYRTKQYVAGAGLIDTRTRFDLWAPRLGVSYAITDTVSIYGSAAQAGQVPSSGELDKNPDLDAATSRSYELGLKGRAERWSFDLAAYYNTVTDDIIPILDEGETNFQNAGETLKIGAELSANVEVMDGLVLGATYGYTDYTFEEFSEVIRGSNVSRDGNRLPYIPRHQYGLSADYRSEGGFKARVSATSWGEYYMDNANTQTYEGYEFLTNVMVGYEVGRHSLTLNVDNVFDQRYAVEAKKSIYGAESYSAGAPLSAMLTYQLKM
ncbi:MAG: TonB-dependent receptor [Proteobacteria bacterium]|nr:TonB-dependent receptor [Pseudomonadota bacterium]